jgi:hypothetical protein
MKSQHLQMRDAINDVELALNGLEINYLVEKWEGADSDIMIKVSLGDLRQLANCYAELNRIINDPSFERET